MINSPFKWVGGKSRLRKSIIPLIPEHTCYVEPLGGAAWVLFGKPPSPIEVLNDIDEDLINFFRVVKRQPEELIKSFDLELVSRSEFQRLAGTDPQSMSEIERAHRFYYLIMAGWGGEARYPRLILSQKVCAGRIRTNVPTPGYNIQSLFRILPQNTVALRCAKSLLPQNGFLRGNQDSRPACPMADTAIG